MDTLPELATTRQLAEAAGVSMAVVQYWVKALFISEAQKAGLTRLFDKAAQQEILDAIRRSARHDEALANQQARQPRQREESSPDLAARLQAMERKQAAWEDFMGKNLMEIQYRLQALEAALQDTLPVNDTLEKAREAGRLFLNDLQAAAQQALSQFEAEQFIKGEKHGAQR